MKTQSNNCGFDYCPHDFVDQENGDVETSGQWRREVARVKGMVQLNNQGSITMQEQLKTFVIVSKNTYIRLKVLFLGKVVNSTTNVFDEQY